MESPRREDEGYNVGAYSKSAIIQHHLEDVYVWQFNKSKKKL